MPIDSIRKANNQYTTLPQVTVLPVKNKQPFNNDLKVVNNI